MEKKNEENGWKSGIDFVPHDAKQRVWAITGAPQVLEAMMGFGLRPQLVPQASVIHGIQAARSTLERAVFHPNCEEIGLSALEQYRREWDDEKKTFRANPLHDWTSHLADAFRYLSLSWKEVPATVIEDKPKQQPAHTVCLLYTSPSPRDGLLSRMPSSA